MIIGLSGGIGCGKSTVSTILKRYGCLVFDADSIAKEMMEVDGVCYLAICEHFPSVINKDRTINRRLLADIVFADETERLWLNACVHQSVYTYYASLHDTYKDKDTCVVFDVPLLFEAKIDELCEVTVCVCCSKETQIQRVMARNGFTRSEVEARIQAQMSQEERMRLSDMRIDNDGTYDELVEKVEELYTNLCTK